MKTLCDTLPCYAWSSEDLKCVLIDGNKVGVFVAFFFSLMFCWRCCAMSASRFSLLSHAFLVYPTLFYYKYVYIICLCACGVCCACFIDVGPFVRAATTIFPLFYVAFATGNHGWIDVVFRARVALPPSLCCGTLS